MSAVDLNDFSDSSLSDDSDNEQSVVNEQKENKQVTLIDYIDLPACIVQIGKSKRGKSYNTRYLISYLTLGHPIFKSVLVFSGSSGINNDYNFLPERCIINGYREDVLMRYMKNMEKIYEKLNEGRDRMEDDIKPPPSLIIFDDLLGKLTKSKFFDSFLSTYRHYNITIILNNQFLKSEASSTLLREQATLAFMYYTQSKNTINSLYEAFGQGFDSETNFREHFLKKANIKLHASMMWSDKIEDHDDNYVRWIAPPPSAFKPTAIEF